MLKNILSTIINTAEKAEKKIALSVKKINKVIKK